MRALALGLPIVVLLLIVFNPLLRKLNPKYKTGFRNLFYKIGLILFLAFSMALFPLILCEILEVEFIKMVLISISALLVSAYFNLTNYQTIKLFFKEWIELKKK